jgi:PASTA domain
MGLRVQVTGRGKVVSQSINAGNVCHKGSAITITLD